MSTQERILDLKRRAIELKRSGDVDGAKQVLAQIRQIEYENVSIQDLSDPISLKKLAVVLKNKGDLQGAKDALGKAKILEEQQKQKQDQQHTDITPKDENQNTQKEGQQKEEEEESHSDNVDEDDVDVTLLEGEEENDGVVAFTDDEMLDIDMMTEFKMYGMDVPSEDQYKAKILESKRSALACKQKGDIAGAKAGLLRSKQFEAIMTKLSQLEEGPSMSLNDDEEAWLQELNEEETEMMRDLMNDDSDVDIEDDDNNMMVLELDDLEDMDGQMLKDVIDEGLMKVPSVEDVQEQAKAKKALALEFKQKGLTKEALAALSESKKLQSSAERLERMLKSINNDTSVNGNDNMEDLEALLENGNDYDKTKRKVQVTKKASVVETKSAEELKKEAIKLRTENNIPEATKVLKLYKEALAKESKAARIKEQREIVGSIRDEIDSIVEDQLRLFQFYQTFVDSKIGLEQYTLWQNYKEDCTNYVKLIEAKDAMVSLSRQKKSTMLRICDEDVVNFVESSADPTDDRLEISILNLLLDVDKNKALQKILKESAAAGGGSSDATDSETTQKQLPKIKVEVEIQIPPNENDTEESIVLYFQPTRTEKVSDKNFVYEFDSRSQHIDNFRRDKTKYSKLVVRRMGWKKINIFIHHVVPSVKKKSSWFGTSSKKEEEDNDKNKPAILGKVVLQLGNLLKRKCIAGDYPLFDKGGRIQVGGTMRLGLRTGVPFVQSSRNKNETEVDNSSMTVTMQPFEPLLFSPVASE